MNFKRLYIEITNICNLNCSFCSPIKREKRSMTLEEIEHILKEFKKYGCHIYPHIKGEPLCHPDFTNFCELVKKYDMPLNVTTNGVFIKKYEDTLLKSARQVNISVHALLDGQIKDENKYLKDVISFGLNAKEKGDINVSFRFWLEEDNTELKGLDIIKEIAKSFNVKVYDDLKKGRNSLKLADNIHISLMNKFTWPSLKDEAMRSYGNCLGGKEMLGILADGTVVPCCLDSDGIINLGNIFKEDIYDILNRERYQTLKDGFSGNNIAEELCKKCTFYDSRKQKNTV